MSADGGEVLDQRVTHSGGMVITDTDTTYDISDTWDLPEGGFTVGQIG
ncbi:MAG: hypothetical protein ACM3UO_00180 [Bacillota bacterium]